MVHCSTCGKENVADANFCRHCGAAVAGAASAWVSEDMEARAKEFARDMERFGKEAGQRAEEFARDLINDVERLVRGRSVCPKCEASWPGVHDYCARCGSKIH
jgi:predicted amidophosphoribosyltransferase